MQFAWTMMALACGACGFWVMLIFNRLVKLRNQQSEGWSGIEVQLKRRHDLIPRLVEAVRGYAAHELGTFRAVTEARTKAAAHVAPDQSPQAETNLSRNLGGVLLLAENYPELKASGNFQSLLDELVRVENDIQFARRFYNGAVRDFRNQTQIFPSNLVAGAFRFRPAEFFELSCATEAHSPEVRM